MRDKKYTGANREYRIEAIGKNVAVISATSGNSPASGPNSAVTSALAPAYAEIEYLYEF